MIDQNSSQDSPNTYTTSNCDGERINLIDVDWDNKVVDLAGNELVLADRDGYGYGWVKVVEIKVDGDIVNNE